MIYKAHVARHDTLSRMLNHWFYCCTSLVVRIFVFPQSIAVERQSRKRKKRTAKIERINRTPHWWKTNYWKPSRATEDGKAKTSARIYMSTVSAEAPVETLATQHRMIIDYCLYKRIDYCTKWLTDPVVKARSSDYTEQWWTFVPSSHFGGKKALNGLLTASIQPPLRWRQLTS